jgi:hypothetical protein
VLKQKQKQNKTNLFWAHGTCFVLYVLLLVCYKGSVPGINTGIRTLLFSGALTPNVKSMLSENLGGILGGSQY